ncbi:MAG: sigma-54-dependent Fis family transcriptional regulator [Micavibrio sp.]|nr:MAG: sigma-54-dependent Fis family transcriptional regulator [Micavibrio sp.]
MARNGTSQLTGNDILIVDDEADIRSLLQGVLEDEGYHCRTAGKDTAVFAALEEKEAALVLLDVWLEDSALDGVGILKKLAKIYPDLPVVMMSGHSTIEIAVSAIKHGAYDFLEKPFEIDRILMTVERALEVGRLKRENRALREKAYQSSSDLHGVSPQISQLRQAAQKAAATESRVLITGAQGTGKNVIARMLHRLSPRCEGAFLSLNCAAHSPDALETVLFGMEGVSAEEAQPGMIEQAAGGTLLLDEIAEMPQDMQGKLVRVLQDGRYMRIGGTQMLPVDVRIIAATGQNLEEKIARKTFREDLYYRLNVVPLHIPPLVERRADIAVLAEYFLQSGEIFDDNNAEGVCGKLQLGEDALAVLQGYAWPGNVRQLKNVMEWLVIMYSGQAAGQNSVLTVSAEMLPPEIRQMPRNFDGQDPVVELMTKPLREAREIFERKYLLAQIERFDGNISKTAGFVGMERSALHRKLKALEVEAQQEDDIQRTPPESQQNGGETRAGGR